MTWIFIFLLLTLHRVQHNFAFKICKLLLNQWVIKCAQLPRSYLFHFCTSLLSFCSYNSRLLQPKSMQIYTKKNFNWYWESKDANFVGLYKRLHRQFNTFTAQQKQFQTDLIPLRKMYWNLFLDKYVSLV